MADPRADRCVGIFDLGRALGEIERAVPDMTVAELRQCRDDLDDLHTTYCAIAAQITGRLGPAEFTDVPTRRLHVV